MRTLVVEDDETQRRMLTEQLVSRGHDVDAVPDGGVEAYYEVGPAASTRTESFAQQTAELNQGNATSIGGPGTTSERQRWLEPSTPA